MRIIKLAFDKVNEWLADRNVEVVCTDEAAEYVYTKGFIPGFGARPLKRAMKKEVMIPISRAMLKEKKRNNCSITLTVEDEVLNFEFANKEPPVEIKEEADFALVTEGDKE